MRRFALLPCLLLGLLLAGCVRADVSLFGNPDAPYGEQVISGSGQGKVLVLPIDGLIGETPRRGLLDSRPSTVQEVAEQLRRARRDKDIKALVLRIDSPGGTVTASDVVHHELMAYKRETGVKIVAEIMGLGASGGYYAALAADRICAQPTALAGSVGVIFLMPRIAGLLDKIGVGVDVSKSGAQKDMGSPFRAATPEERKLTDAMVRAEAARFLALVQERRGLAPSARAVVATARVFTAAEAQKLGLVDSIGYMEDAVAEAERLAGLPADARVVAYRRRPAAEPTWYAPAAESEAGGIRPTLVNVDLAGLLPLRAGMYALWTPGVGR